MPSSVVYNLFLLSVEIKFATQLEINAEIAGSGRDTQEIYIDLSEQGLLYKRLVTKKTIRSGNPPSI